MSVPTLDYARPGTHRVKFQKADGVPIVVTLLFWVLLVGWITGTIYAVVTG